MNQEIPISSLPFPGFELSTCTVTRSGPGRQRSNTPRTAVQQSVAGAHTTTRRAADSPAQSFQQGRHPPGGVGLVPAQYGKNYQKRVLGLINTWRRRVDVALSPFAPRVISVSRLLLSLPPYVRLAPASSASSALSPDVATAALLACEVFIWALASARAPMLGSFRLLRTDVFLVAGLVVALPLATE